MSDTFRKAYKGLTTRQVELMYAVKEAAELLEEAIARVPSSRETALAVTKLEESVMWATKAIT
jgi:hypothetical protein